MDESRFDTLVKVLAVRRPRRAALPLLAALGLGLAHVETGAAKKQKRGEKKIQICHCSGSDATLCTTQKNAKDTATKLLRTNPCAYKGRCQGVSGCPGGVPDGGTGVGGDAPGAGAPPPGCVPEPQATTCARGCGDQRNNCHQAVSCPCPGGQTCLSNGTCARPCTDNSQCTDCAGTIGCSLVTTEGTKNCVAPAASLCTDFQSCSSTGECPLGFHCQVCGLSGSETNRCIAIAICPAS